MGIFTPIAPLEFDASFSYIQRLMHLCMKLNEQGVAINTIQEFLNSLDIDQKIKDEVFKQFVNTPNLKTVLEHRKILIVGDSYTYGSGLADRNTRFTQLMKNKGFDVTDVSSPGGGFVAVGDNGTFYKLINDYSQGDETDYTDVWFLGGINDSYADLSDVYNLILNTVNLAHSKFINAKISIGYISQTHRLADGGCNYNKVMITRQAYREVCLLGKCCYIDNADYMLKQYSAIQSDGIHPTEVGHQLIANYLTSYLLNGNISVTRYAENITLNMSSQLTGSAFNVEERVENGVTTINQLTPSVYAVADNIKMKLDGNASLVLGDMKDGLIYGQTNGLNQFGCVNINIPAVVTYSDSNTGAFVVECMPCSLRMTGKTVFLAPLKLNDTASDYRDVYLKQINLPPWSVTLSSDMI